MTVILWALDRVRGRALGWLGPGSPKSQPHQALRAPRRSRLHQKKRKEKKDHVGKSCGFRIPLNRTHLCARADNKKNGLNVSGTLLEYGGSACFLQDEWGGGESYSTSASGIFGLAEPRTGMHLPVKENPDAVFAAVRPVNPGSQPRCPGRQYPVEHPGAFISKKYQILLF